MIYLHNFVKQAKELQKMEQEIFLVVKGSLKLLEFYSAGYSRHQRQKSAQLCRASRSPSHSAPPLHHHTPVPGIRGSPTLHKHLLDK